MDVPPKSFQEKNKYTKAFFDLNYAPIPKIDENLKIKAQCKKDFVLSYESKNKTLMNLILKIIRWEINERITIEDCIAMIDDLQKEIKLKFVKL